MKLAIAQAILKYPNWDEWKHEILLTQETKKYAGQEEQRLIEFYKCQDRRYGYNISSGGEGSPLSEESKKKMSESSKSFKHSEEEKIRRSKPIFIVRNNKLIPCISAKVHADSIGRTRSEVSAAIKRGIKINNEYIFYQNKEERIKCVNHIIEKKQKQNKVSKKSLKEYLLVYYLFFKESDFVKESVETNM